MPGGADEVVRLLVALVLSTATAAAGGEAGRQERGEEEPDGCLEVRRRAAHRGECTISARAKRSCVLQALNVDP